MKKTSGLFSRIKWFAAIVMLVFSLSLAAPQPAQADGVTCGCVVPAIAALAGLTSSGLAAVVAAIEALQAYITLKLMPHIAKQGGAIVTAIEMLGRKNTDIGNAQNDALYATTLAQTKTLLIAEDGMDPTITFTRICKNIRTKQAAEHARVAAGANSDRMIAGEQKHSQGAGAGGSGVGPTSVAERIGNRCGKDTNEAGGFIDLDLLPEGMEDCAPKNTTGDEAETEERINADIKASTLRASVGNEPLERPVVKDDGVLKPKNNDQAQLMFTAARDYCYNVAGPTPKAPEKNTLLTSEGRVRMASYSRCAAVQSAFTKQCFDQVNYIARPDCDDVDNAEECKLHHAVCTYAKGNGVELPTTFGACESDSGPGLSLYQIEWIQHKLCGTGQAAIDAIGAGANAPELLAKSDLCAISTSIWRSEVVQREANMLAGIAALTQMDACWGQVVR